MTSSHPTGLWGQAPGHGVSDRASDRNDRNDRNAHLGRKPEIRAMSVASEDGYYPSNDVGEVWIFSNFMRWHHRLPKNSKGSPEYSRKH